MLSDTQGVCVLVLNLIGNRRTTLIVGSVVCGFKLEHFMGNFARKKGQYLVQ